MSQIAGETGIGRATLYKYFSDVGAILLAWHERHVTIHLAHLTEARDQAGDTGERLAAVLGAYALIRHEHHASELAALLHRGEHIARAQRQLTDLIRGMLTEAVESGDVRDDVAPDELASYCLHALAAASSLPSRAAVRRLVTVTLVGFAPHRLIRLVSDPAGAESALLLNIGSAPYLPATPFDRGGHKAWLSDYRRDQRYAAPRRGCRRSPENW